MKAKHKKPHKIDIYYQNIVKLKILSEIQLRKNTICPKQKSGHFILQGFSTTPLNEMVQQTWDRSSFIQSYKFSYDFVWREFYLSLCSSKKMDSFSHFSFSIHKYILYF